MKLLLLSLALASAAVVAQAADNDSITGKWQVYRNGSGDEKGQSCTFTQKDNNLTGSCNTEGGAAQITGKVDGKQVTWTYQSEVDGTPLTMTFHGTLQSATKITGTLNAEEMEIEGYFTANKSQ